MQNIFKIITLAFFISLQACNTMQGFGKDMQAGGQSIENAASKAKSSM